MCLVIPGKVINKEDGKDSKVTIDFGIQKIVANNSLINANIGDYVFVNGGIVIDILDKKRAKELIKSLERLEDGHKDD